jgi:hypothetical protein
VSSRKFVEEVSRGMAEAYLTCTPEQQATLRTTFRQELTPQLRECWDRACELLGLTEQTGQQDGELPTPGLRHRERLPMVG